jgi:hypothetical protein
MIREGEKVGRRGGDDSGGREGGEKGREGFESEGGGGGLGFSR